MRTQKCQNHGFTLVELAIVLIIIGLLIGGTLKGQELINGARATATVSQIRAMEAGALTFLDTYKGFPGDLRDATTKLPNCSGDCAPVNGGGAAGVAKNTSQTVGNGQVDYVPGSSIATGQENIAFFVQMFNADLLDGIDGTTGAAKLGKNILPTKLGNSTHFRVGYVQRGCDIQNTGGAGGTNTRTGHYLGLFGDLDFDTLINYADGTAGYNCVQGSTNWEIPRTILPTHGFQPAYAQRIDAKYDDGNPATGNVVATNVGFTTSELAAGRCADNGSQSGNEIYNTQIRGNECVLYARFAP